MKEDWSLWGDKTKWPFAPSGHVFLPSAAEQVFSARFGDRWYSPFTHREDALDGDRTNAIRRRLVNLLHRLFADQLLMCSILNPDTGEVYQLRPAAWNCEARIALERIRICRIDMADPFVKKTTLTTDWRWLFVQAQNLEAVCAVLDTQRQGATVETDLAGSDGSACTRDDALSEVALRPKDSVLVPPATHYQRQSIEPPARRQLKKFLQMAEGKGWLDRRGEDYRSMEVMLPVYQEMCRKLRPTPVRPYQHSAFNKWVGKYMRKEWPIAAP